MGFKEAFGDDFQLGFDLKNYPQLKDNSYHNDTSPNFWFRTPLQYFTLWIDYSDRSNRENENMRYSIITAENFGDEDYPEISSSNGNIVFECELPSEIIDYLDNLTFT